MIIKDILVLLDNLILENNTIDECPDKFNIGHFNIKMPENERIKLRKNLANEITAIQSEAENICKELTDKLKPYGINFNKNSGFNFAGRCGKLIKNIDNLINDLIKIKDFPQEIINKLSELKKQKIDLIKKSRDYLTLGFYDKKPEIYGDLSSCYPDNSSTQPILFCGN
jgi:hypothetical protein